MQETCRVCTATAGDTPAGGAPAGLAWERASEDWVPLPPSFFGYTGLEAFSLKNRAWEMTAFTVSPLKGFVMR